MQKKSYVLSLVVLFFGLTSCTKDKPQDPEVDTWNEAPNIQILRHADNSVAPLSKTGALEENDIVEVNQTSGAQSARSASVESSCINAQDKIITRNEGIPLKEHYSVIELLPVDALPIRLYQGKLPYQPKCQIALRFVNALGSSRIRTIPQMPINFHLDSPQIEINGELATPDAKIRYEAQDLGSVFVRSPSSTGLTSLVCEDFTVSSDKDYVSLLELTDKAKTNDFDWRAAYPLQTCRLYQRPPDHSLIYSRLIQILFPSPAVGAKSEIVISQNWESAFLSELTVAKTTITNTKSYPLFLRAAKNQGKMSVRISIGTAVNFNHAPNGYFIGKIAERPTRLSVETKGSAEVIEQDQYMYVRLEPRAQVQFAVIATLNIRCSNQNEVWGMDFSFIDNNFFTIERGARPLRKEQLDLFETVSSSPFEMPTNLVKPTGPNRGVYYAHFLHSQFRQPPEGDVEEYTLCDQ